MKRKISKVVVYKMKIKNKYYLFPTYTKSKTFAKILFIFEWLTGDYFIEDDLHD